MIEHKTVVDAVEVSRNGTVQVRIALLLVEDGVELDCKWHRTALNVDSDVSVQFDAVNTHLESMGKQPVSMSDVDFVRSLHLVYKSMAR